MTDPASLNVNITITGLHVKEAAALLAALPDGVTYNGSTVQPALGTARHTITVHGLSLTGSRLALAELEQFMETIANAGQDGDTDGR